MSTTRRASRSGFTLVELLIVVVVVSLLAGLALPNLQRAILKARAIGVVAEMEVIRVAALGYLGEYHQYPPDGYFDGISVGFREYLPEGYVFKQDDIWYDWNNWDHVGARWAVGRRYNVAVAFNGDEELAREVARVLSPNATLGRGRGWNVTWLIEAGT